ncbi:MAG: FHA domain-containing protein [Lachnospiraceae bacterium]|nr:FHA domain-containing protein [Lachnospiraceae bacterium]
MLQIEYKNSFNHNYLKLKAEWKQDRKMRYQYRIITSRKLEGLLTANTYLEDEEQGISYDISSKQSLSKYFLKGKITVAWMERLEAALKAVLWSLEQYLLDNRNLILRPDCIFQDMDSDKINFIYYPYYIEKEKTDMEEFLSFFIKHTDEEENELLDIFYDMYSDWEYLQDQFTIETFLLLWEKHRQSAKEEPVEEIQEKSVLPETHTKKPEEDGRMLDIREILFGKYRKAKEETQKSNVAMEQWEYQADPAVKEPASEVQEKTAYLEVRPETEERKLFGNGRQNRKVIALDKLPLIIGKKGEKADVILSDTSISKMHARVTEENGQIYLEDLNTTNGTYKNGVRLKPYERVELLKEDEVRLGKLEFTYR